jgi:hypothetical protein
MQVENDRVFESVFLIVPSISNQWGFNVPKTTSVDYCILIINTLVLIENQKVQNIQNIFQQYMFPGVNLLGVGKYSNNLWKLIDSLYQVHVPIVTYIKRGYRPWLYR